jgi:hypothetical protein
MYGRAKLDLAPGPPNRRYMTKAAPKLRQSQNCTPNDNIDPIYGIDADLEVTVAY